MSQESKGPTKTYSGITVELSVPEPPKFVEPRGGQGLILYGEDNMYPDYLIDLYRKSPKHNAIINRKVLYATGNGLAVKKLGKSMQQIAGFNALIKKKNSQNENMNKISARNYKDYEIFNGFSSEVIWSKNGKTWTEYYVPFSLIRKFIEGEGENAKIRYCYLPKWDNVKTLDKARQQKGYKEYDLFGTNNSGTELIYYVEPREVKSGESDAYPIPYYYGAIPYIECDIEVAEYCKNSVYNDFGGNKMVTFTNGEPATPEMKNSIEQRFKRKFAGGKNARRVIINFVDSPEQKPIIDTLSTENIGDQFETLNGQIRDELFIVHNVTNASLFGIPVEGALGGRSEIMDAYELFTTTWTEPRRTSILEEKELAFNTIGLSPELSFEPVKPLGIAFSENVLTQYMDQADIKEAVYKQLGITPNEDEVNQENKMADAISSLSPLVANRVLESLTQNEIRSLAKLPPKTGGETLLGSQEAQVLQMFENSAIDGYVDSFKVELTEAGFPVYSDSGYKALYMAKVFDISLTDTEAEIISAIAAEPKITAQQLAEALGLSVDEVTTAVEKLTGLKVLKGELGASMKITKAGETVLEENDVPLNITVEFAYTDEGAPALRPGGESRPFCKKMMAMTRAGKTWTREEIERIKNEDGKSAWIYRGGFYHNPDNDKDTPFCRHHWKAVIKKRRRAA